ncbi:uncharacterized protein LOC143235648 [Tachypleus tridentatus]|uniref:uncharacterized protein LOC143235648 n=1 Tax=Tachypleus tridentatus TaxID=6853 RepID=UPI003FD209E1
MLHVRLVMPFLLKGISVYADLTSCNSTQDEERMSKWWNISPVESEGTYQKWILQRELNPPRAAKCRNQIGYLSRDVLCMTRVPGVTFICQIRRFVKSIPGLRK